MGTLTCTIGLFRSALKNEEVNQTGLARLLRTNDHDILREGGELWGSLVKLVFLASIIF